MPQKSIFQKYLTEMEGKLSILDDKSEENTHNTLSALWHTASGNRLSAIRAVDFEIPFLAESQQRLLESLIGSRLQGVPLAHLTERQHFMGLDYILNNGHYIPRKETELLAGSTIKLLIQEFGKSEKVTVLDLCSGIGSVALAIAYYCKNARVYGSDIYQPAVIAAEINAKHFGLEKLATFFHSDMFDSFENQNMKNKVDIIVSAPPYISSVKVKQMAHEIANHEPYEAFDAGTFGLNIFNKLIAISPEYLCENGYLIFECGLGQGEFLARRIRANTNYSEVTEICDLNGNIRVIRAKRAAKTM